MALFCWLTGLPAVSDGLLQWPGRTVRGVGGKAFTIICQPLVQGLKTQHIDLRYTNFI